MAKINKILIILLSFLLVFVSTCFAKNKGENSLIELSPIIGGSPRKIMYRVVDKQAGVICYFFKGWTGTGSGISCVPLKNTKLFLKKNFSLKIRKNEQIRA